MIPKVLVLMGLSVGAGAAQAGDYNAIVVKTEAAQPTALDLHVSNVVTLVRASEQVMIKSIQEVGTDAQKIIAAIEAQKLTQKGSFAAFENLRTQEYLNLRAKVEEPVEARAGVARKERKSVGNSYRFYPPTPDWALAQQPKLEEAVRFGSVDSFAIKEWQDPNCTALV